MCLCVWLGRLNLVIQCGWMDFVSLLLVRAYISSESRTRWWSLGAAAAAAASSPPCPRSHRSSNNRRGPWRRRGWRLRREGSSSNSPGGRRKKKTCCSLVSTAAGRGAVGVGERRRRPPRIAWCERLLDGEDAWSFGVLILYIENKIRKLPVVSAADGCGSCGTCTGDSINKKK